MQILKNTIRQNIISKARDEFFKKGYHNSSMRSMAKSSGITVGNLYKYFQNKADLFSTVITPAYTYFKRLFKHHHHSQELLAEDFSPLKVKQILDDFISVFVDYRKEFLIIINRSQGTKYENFYKGILRVTEKNLEFHLRSIIDIDKANIMILSQALSNSFMQGIIEIFRRESNKNKIKILITDYFTIFIRGLIGINQ